ncbi:MAG: hypothetical protein V3T30_00225, partial [Thermodesulfobacteriota bacterium]
LNKYILRDGETLEALGSNFCLNCHRISVYGDEGYIGADNSLYSRVKHPLDYPNTWSNSPFYQVGATTGTNANSFGNVCLTCHGGNWNATDSVIEGIHGSNAAAGPAVGSDPLGYRMMNGACVESYTPPQLTGPATDGSIVFKSSTDDHCLNSTFGTITLKASGANTVVQYNCRTVADCSN